MQPSHLKWLCDTGESLNTKDGKAVSIFELNHEEDEEILSEWANHFRNHYCCDSQIETLVDGTGLTKSEYLTQIKFPDKSAAPGPSIRSGDFAEILAANYLEYVLNYWVPQTRYNDKTVRNESTKGVDTIGFHFEKTDDFSPNDTLIIIESKATYSGKKHDNRLQTAIDHSEKDITRKAESLNAIKQRFINMNSQSEVVKVQRFQNQADNPYKQKYGAIAHLDINNFSDDVILNVDSSNHPFHNDLFLVVIKGPKMMKLIHKLYEQAANEA